MSAHIKNKNYLNSYCNSVYGIVDVLCRNKRSSMALLNSTEDAVPVLTSVNSTDLIGNIKQEVYALPPNDLHFPKEAYSRISLDEALYWITHDFRMKPSIEKMSLGFSVAMIVRGYHRVITNRRTETTTHELYFVKGDCCADIGEEKTWETIAPCFISKTEYVTKEKRSARRY